MILDRRQREVGLGFVSSIGVGTNARAMGGGATCSRFNGTAAPTTTWLAGGMRARTVGDGGRAWAGDGAGRGTVQATATPVEVTEATFEEEVLRSDMPVVVDFYASWCGPCKLMTPLMDWAAAEFEGKIKMVKINTEENESFVKTYEIYGLPTFAVFVDGEARGLHEGAMTKAVFKTYIEEHSKVKL